MVLGQCAGDGRDIRRSVCSSPTLALDGYANGLTGFMTFAPEWLSGSANLDTSNFMYLYVYLIFFNMLWVVFPLWVLYEAYGNINRAFVEASSANSPESKKRH